MEQAYTTKAGAGLVAIELTSGEIVHQSSSFRDLTSWIPVQARGNIRVSLEARDGDEFRSFCQSVVRDVGELYEDTFLDRDKVMGRSIIVRFFTRAPGPPGLRNPEWLLMMRPVKLTLVGVQPRQLAGQSPTAGTRLPFFGQTRISEAVGIFTADLSGGSPQQWTLQVAHVRYLLDLEVASGTYDMEASNMKPFETIAILFNFEFSKAEGGGASVFSRAMTQLEHAATSALNLAQRSASWLTRKALKFSHHFSILLSDDDTVSISSIALFTFAGGSMKTSVKHDWVAGKVGFAHGGLDILYFVSDPAQPLESILRATIVRISSAKNRGEFDVQHPFVFSSTWGDGEFRFSCGSITLDTVGKKVPSVEDVSQILEQLKVSPGGGLLSDGSVSIFVGGSDV